MLVREAARLLLDYYPRIFHACHTRHVRDPRTRNLLSSHQASILDHLDEVDPTSLSGLAAHAGVTPSTMSLSVERLVRAGYVLRVRDKSDARRVNLRLSPAGLRIKQANSVLDAARVRALLGRLSDAERSEALRGLAMLAHAAQLEMHSKVLYGLRSPGRTRPTRPKLSGDRHVEVDLARPRGAGAADRPGRDHRRAGSA